MNLFGIKKKPIKSFYSFGFYQKWLTMLQDKTIIFYYQIENSICRIIMNLELLEV